MFFQVIWLIFITNRSINMNLARLHIQRQTFHKVVGVNSS